MTFRSATWCVGVMALAGTWACSPPATNNADGGADASGDATIAMDATPAPEAGPDAPLARPMWEACEATESAPPLVQPDVNSTLQATLAPMMARVTSPDLGRNPVMHAAEVHYRERGMDRISAGPAQDRVRRTDLGGGATAYGTRKSLAYFVQFSDTQVVDDESPTRLGLYDSPATPGALRPQEAYLGRAISAMNRTLASLERNRPFAFGVVAGDCADSAQYNELRWFTQIMDGATGIRMDSGDLDNLIDGADNDPKDPFDAVAFPAPWYFVPGNHDVEVVGISAITDTFRTTALGGTSVSGTRDYRRNWGEPRTGSVPPDPNRRLLSRDDIVSTLRTESGATPGPAGHGFATTGGSTNLGANWVADVIPGLLRIVAVDTSDPSGGSMGMLRQAQVDGFLRPALMQAQTDGVLVMLASHHRPGSMDRKLGELGPALNPDALEPAAIETLVAGYPHVIAWLVGHDHDVLVRPVAGADAAHPGYWEIQSGSIADWPNQARVMEIVDNGNGTLSLFGTMVDYQARSCMERRYRRLAMLDYVTAWDSVDHTGSARDRNVELVIPIPAAAQARISTVSATAPADIESETTLRGTR